MMRPARIAVFLCLLVAAIAWGIPPMESDQPAACVAFRLPETLLGICLVWLCMVALPASWRIRCVVGSLLAAWFAFSQVFNDGIRRWMWGV